MDSRKIGFYSTLCAVQVPEDKIEAVAAVINQLPGVTHNYLRDHDYNIWFTLTDPHARRSPGHTEGTGKLFGLGDNQHARPEGL